MVLGHDINKSTRTKDVTIQQNITFDTMLLSEKTLKGLKKCGFHKPSPIQLHGIPLGKCGFDLILEAKSGTGKTAVFTIIALEKFDCNNDLQALILTPTREIAAQICNVIKTIGHPYSELTVEVVMGGLPFAEDVAKFAKPNKVHMVVGSPGRLRHLIQQKHIDTSGVRLLVLDEADKLMEKSFQTDINYIFATLPEHKQVIMSSATYSDTTKEFLSKYMIKSQHVCPDTTRILIGIEQKVSLVKYNSNIITQTLIRYEELIKIFTNKQFKQCLVFCNYQARVTELYRLLSRDKWPAQQLYGQQDQCDRLQALQNLQDFKCRILISTDLAARGVDVSNVDLVVNFEPPFEWTTYLHRIGRAGRYGSYGSAITILSNGKEETNFKSMLAFMNNSLEIRHLWSNDVMIFNDDIFGDISVNNNLEKNDVKSEKDKNSNIFEIPEITWNKIVKNSSNSPNLVESFDQLNLSFESNEIVSFDNLLDSFEKESTIKNDNSIYNVLNFDEPECEVQNKEQNTNFKNLSLKVDSSAEVNNFNSLKKDNVKRDKSDVNNTTKNTETLEHNGAYKSFLNGKECEEYEDSYLYCSPDIMAQAGLPTSFVTKKHMHPKNEKLKKKKTKNVKQIQVQSSPRNKVEINPNYKPKNRVNHVNTETKRINGNECLDSFSSDESISVNEDMYEDNLLMRKNNYCEWYRQLKQITQQMEMAFYIQEMSNMG